MELPNQPKNPRQNRQHSGKRGYTTQRHPTGVTTVGYTVPNSV